MVLVAAKTSIEEYVKNVHKEVEGWFAGNQLVMLLIADQLQKRLGISGAIGEIGVHYGRLFLLMMLLRRAEEKAVAMDVFDLQLFNTDYSGLGDLNTFLANVDRHVGTRDGLEIVKGDSMQIEPAEILSVTNGERFRMFSVDGSHTTHNTASDLRVAHRLPRQGGMIIVDDYFNGGFPMAA